MKRVDVAVLGAGAAGLAAARALTRRGLNVVVLEARGRTGGRVWTRHDPAAPLPVELGAEFLHGDVPRTDRLLREARGIAVTVSGSHLEVVDGRVRAAATFVRDVARVLGRVDPDEDDLSLDDFLARKPGGAALARARSVVRGFVEGFHAAPAGDIGVRSIAPAGGADATGAATHMGRVVTGYDAVTRTLAHGLDVRTRHVVRAVRWRPGAVELVGKAFTLHARAAVITAPVGVLKRRGALLFDPEPLPVRRALEGLGMGAVARLVLAFRRPVWNEALGREVGFLHVGDEGAFPVFWSMLPERAPMLVAWAGGPGAVALAARPVDEQKAIALRRLARALGTTVRTLARELTGAWTHDWQKDPFARGAYSYARVGGEGAARMLAKPVEGTLFFAGEATVEDGSATVEGALASGARAARVVSRILGMERSLR